MCLRSATINPSRTRYEPVIDRIFAGSYAQSLTQEAGRWCGSSASASGTTTSLLRREEVSQEGEEVLQL